MNTHSIHTSTKPGNEECGRMEAIACGVQARFEENTGYEKRITEATINVARALGVSELEIGKWAEQRQAMLARKSKKFQEIRHLLEESFGNTFENCQRIRPARNSTAASK